MSDDWANSSFTTPEYDYGSYYEEPGVAPCSSVSMKYFSKVFVPILYSLVFILGFIGNGLVVCVLVKHRNQTNLTDICIFNLALSDLLFVIVLPFFSHYIVVSQWTFGDFMCRFTAGSHTVGFFSSIFFMVVMTLDRYMVIMHAQKMVGYRTMRAGLTLTVSVWILSLCVSLPAFIFNKVTNESYGYGCTDSQDEQWKNYDLFTTNVLGLVIPLLVMVVCYSRIIPRVMNMRTAKRHRAIRLIIAIMVVFFLFWAPFNISRFLKFLLSKGIIPFSCTWDQNLTLAITVTEAFAYTHCCLNPVIYGFVGQKFMKRVMQMLKKWVPGICRNLPESSFRNSSIVSRSSDATSTVIM